MVLKKQSKKTESTSETRSVQQMKQTHSSKTSRSSTSSSTKMSTAVLGSQLLDKTLDTAAADDFKAIEGSAIVSSTSDGGTVGRKFKSNLNEKFTVSSSSTSSKFHQHEYSSKKHRNEQIISSIDLLESEKKEPVFSVPIEEIDFATIPSGSNVKIISSSSHSQNLEQSKSQYLKLETSNETDGQYSFAHSEKESSVAATTAEMISSPSKYIDCDIETGFDLRQSVADTSIADLSDAISIKSSTATNMHMRDMTSCEDSTNQVKSVRSLSSIKDSDSSKKTTAATSATTTTTTAAANSDISQQIDLHNKKTESKTITKKEIYDTKTKKWTEYSDKSLTYKKHHPTFERYVSEESDGTYKITYKKKIFDQRNNEWKVVEEKVVDNTSDVGFHDIIDDVINTTTTTYTTKVFDSKLGKWQVVDEKSFVDSKAFVPNDIAREIEKDNTDVANITTTTEVTKIFDASINDWRVLDERTHTDVIEKIVQAPKKTLYIDEFVEIEKNSLETENIQNITDINNSYAKSKIVSEHVIESDNTRKNFDSKKKGIVKIEDKKSSHTEKCICEICTCGRHHCVTSKNDVIDVDDNEFRSVRKNTWTKSDFERISKESQLQEEHSKTLITNEGEIILTGQREDRLEKTHVSERLKMKPVERPVQKKPEDNLRPEGEFYSPEKEEYRPSDRPLQIRPEGNLKPEGDFVVREKQPFKAADRTERIIRRDNLHTEGEMIFEKTEEYHFVSRPEQVKPQDNLRPEGEFYSPEKPKFRPAERPQQKRPEDNLYPEGEFHTPDKPDYRPAETQKQIRHTDNLKPEGDFYTPESHKFQPGERPSQVKPKDNLRPEGEFKTPDKPIFRPAERPIQKKPSDNLFPEGEFHTPEKPQFKPVERPVQKKPVDNLRPEGEFHSRDKAEYRPSDRPQQIRPEDNLKPEGDFVVREKQPFKPADRTERIIRKDNLRSEGDMIFEKNTKEFKALSRVQQFKPKDNLRLEGDRFAPEISRTKIQKSTDSVITEISNKRVSSTAIDQVDSQKKVLPVRPKDNLKLEGPLYTLKKEDTKISTKKESIHTTQQRQVTSKFSHNESSISLGSDDAILKTTNQMSFATANGSTKVIKQNGNGPSDGLVIVTTKQVTTVIGSNKAKEPETNYVKRQEKVKVNENVSKVKTKTDIKNIKSSHLEEEIVQHRPIAIKNSSSIALGSTQIDKTTSSSSIDHKGTSASSCISLSSTLKDQNASSTSLNQKTTSTSSHVSNQAEHVSSATTTNKLFHHRRSELTSESTIANSVFHRKNTSTEQGNYGSLSSNGKIQRKSILNLHEQQPVYMFPSERQSYSSLYKQNKEIESKTSQSMEKRIFSSVQGSQRESHSGKSSMLASESSGFISPVITRTGQYSRGQKSHVNISPITLGSDFSSSSSGRKIEHFTSSGGTCAVHKIKEGAYKHTRDTKEHKFYKSPF